MGIFGRSEAQEKAQFTAAFNQRFDELYAAEIARTRGWVSSENLVRIGFVAADWAMGRTYKRGQRMRVIELDIERMFHAKRLEDASTMSARLDSMDPDDLKRAHAEEQESKSLRFRADSLFT